MSESVILERNLGISMRPRRLSDMVGLDGVIDQMRRQFAVRVPAALMFVGAPGAGKTTIAKILALALNCDHGEFGEPCEQCIEDQSNFEIIERNAAAVGTADDTRQLLNCLQFQPVFGKYRVIILDECQQMTQAAQNILLKPTEPDVNAAQFNVFIFCTTDPGKMIPALKSRCISVRLPGMDYVSLGTLVERTLVAAGVASDFAGVPELITLLWQREVTSPRDIIKAVENLVAGLSPELAAVSLESGKINVGFLCGTVIKGDWDGSRALLSTAEPNDGATIRIVLCGFFRKKLLESPAGSTRAKLLSEFIIELTDHNTPEVGIQLSAVIASIYRICQMSIAAQAR